MTDEQRKLCADLRAIGPLIGKGAVWVVTDHAADEIERLAALAQSDAEPVAWRIQDYRAGLIFLCGTREQAREEADVGSLVQPLYTAPPRPDASVGLIEAAEMAERNADEDGGYGPNALRYLAKVLRARAADRSKE
jgi:hypothetical protein